MHRARLTTLGGLLIAIAVGRPLGAQDRALVELGASLIHFPADTVDTFGPSVRWSGWGERGAFAGSIGIGAVGGPSGGSGFLDLSGRRVDPLGGGWQGELGAELGGLLSTAARSASPWAANGLLSARLLRPVGAGGVWLRGSGSLTQRARGLLPGQGIGGGAWWRWPGVQVVTSIAREWNVAQLFSGPQREGYVGTVPVAYTEAAVGVEIERDAATLSLSGTARRDPGADHLVEHGVSVTAVLWQAPTRAIFLGVASQLPDFVHGGDAAQSITVGLRLQGSSPVVVRARRARPIIHVTGDSAQRTVRVRAAGARRVEIMGDFSDWEPVELAPAGDGFSTIVAMPAGNRRIVVRVDGGTWLLAANTPAVDDDFGGRVGLLLVP